MAKPHITAPVEDAKEQAADYFGFASAAYIEVEKDGVKKVFEIPNPGLMNDDQQERWDELQFEMEGWDREDDIIIPERTLEDGSVIPGATIPGDFKTPYRINGELLKPPYSVRLAIALWGKEGYEEYKAGGGISNQIPMEWARMNAEYQKRVDADPKSDGDVPALESVPTGN